MWIWILFLIAGFFFLLTAVLMFLTGDLINGLLFLALAVSNGALAWHYRIKAFPVYWLVAVSVVASGLAVALLVVVMVGDFT